MGMTAHHARPTPHQLDRAHGDPAWAHAHALTLERTGWERATAPTRARFHHIGKTWGALAVLLAGRDLPVEPPRGAAAIPGAPS